MTFSLPSTCHVLFPAQKVNQSRIQGAMSFSVDVAVALVLSCCFVTCQRVPIAHLENLAIMLMKRYVLNNWTDDFPILRLRFWPRKYRMCLYSADKLFCDVNCAKYFSG